MIDKFYTSLQMREAFHLDESGRKIENQLNFDYETIAVGGYKM
jgi:hypothetical protein